MSLFDSLFDPFGVVGDNGGVNGLLGALGFGGDPAAPTTRESTAQVLEALQAAMPGLFSSINSQILPTEQAKLAAQQATAPGQAALNTQITREYAPQLAAVENQISRDRKLSDAQGDLGVVRGPGKELATEATNLASTVIDPEFFKVRSAVGNKQTELANSFDVNGLSGGERAEVERSLNADAARTGNLGRSEGINTVNNAMHYGSALNNKRAQIGNVLSQTAATAPALRSGIDPYGRAQTNAPFTNSFQSVQPVGGEAHNTGSNFLGLIGSLRQQENQINADRRDPLDRVTSLIGAI